MRFATYGLIDPRDGLVFYVGQSGQLKSRLIAHMGCDPGMASYHRVMDLRRYRQRFEFCIYGEFDTRHEALRLERSLILSLDGLTNAKTGHGFLSLDRYPITTLDHSLLAAAISPAPIARAYSSIVRVGGDIKPMVHREGAYE